MTFKPFGFLSWRKKSKPCQSFSFCFVFLHLFRFVSSSLVWALELLQYLEGWVSKGHSPVGLILRTRCSPGDIFISSVSPAWPAHMKEEDDEDEDESGCSRRVQSPQGRQWKWLQSLSLHNCKSQADAGLLITTADHSTSVTYPPLYLHPPMMLYVNYGKLQTISEVFLKTGYNEVALFTSQFNHCISIEHILELTNYY